MYAFLKLLIVVWSLVRHRVTCATILNITKHGEITTLFQFTGTGSELDYNRI